MTLEKFRIRHSYLIEQYQFVEHHLEGIYASACNSGFFKGLEEVGKSNLNKLVREIRRIENEKRIQIISEELYAKIEKIIERRNFWCHNCYVDMLFKSNGDPKKEEDIKTLNADIAEAEKLKDVLFELKQQFLEKIKPYI